MGLTKHLGEIINIPLRTYIYTHTFTISGKDNELITTKPSRDCRVKRWTEYKQRENKDFKHTN